MENSYFLNSWAGCSYEDVSTDVYSQFQIEKSQIDRYYILIGILNDEGYESSVYMLLMEKSSGDLYEVSGSQCSRYGYEGQFETEKTDIRYLLSEHYCFGGYTTDEMRKKLQQFLVTKIRYLKLDELFKEGF